MISFVLFLCPLVLGLLCWCTTQRLVSVLSPPVLSSFVLSCLKTSNVIFRIVCLRVVRCMFVLVG